MKFYLLEIDDVGGVETYGPFDSPALRDARARMLVRQADQELGEDHGYLYVKVCGEVIGRLEADGYSDLELL